MTPFWDPNFSPPCGQLAAPYLYAIREPGPNFKREPGWVKTLRSSYSKSLGSVASSLPLAGPEEGSISEFFELISVWAETAHFQLPTPRG